MPSPAAKPIIAGLIQLAAWTGIALLGDVRQQPVAFVLLYGVAFAAYAGAVGSVLAGRHLSPWIVLGLALVLRLVVLGAPVSDDVNRYLWEGRVQGAGFDPYTLPPDAPELTGLARDDPYRGAVNHPGWTAIYPPATMLWHRVVAAASYTPLAMKLSFLLAEAALVLALVVLLRQRGLGTERLLLYAWNPLAVLSVALEGHHESVAVALLLGALALLVSRRPLLAAGLFALSVMSKGFALAAAPALFEWRRPAAALGALLVALGVALLCVIPFLDAGAGLVTSLLAFGSDLHYNDSLHALASTILGPQAAKVAMAATWLLLAAWTLRATPPDPLRRTAILLAGMLLVLPTVHPWYLLTLLPFLCLFPWWGWLALSGTVALTWLPHLEIQATGRWAEWPLLKLVEYAPLAAWFAWLTWNRIRVARTAPSLP